MDLKEEDNRLYINYMGGIPFSIEDLKERSYLVGPGTDRPIGFVFNIIHFLYWNVKAFDIQAYSISSNDPFVSFMIGGGFTGTLIGSMTGITIANMDFLKGIGGIYGKTKISNISKIKKRIKSEKDPNKPPLPEDEELILDENGQAEVLYLINEEPNEGSISSAGPIHSLKAGKGYCSIDFSDIIYVKNQYWPKIIINWVVENDDIVTSCLMTTLPNGKINRIYRYNIEELSGGVIFMGAPIKMYRTFNNYRDFIAPIKLAQGLIKPGSDPEKDYFMYKK